MMGNKKKANDYMKKAEDMADIWTVTADNGDGSYKLAFDREGTFSMKYNIIWDKLLNCVDPLPSQIRFNEKNGSANGIQMASIKKTAPKKCVTMRFPMRPKVAVSPIP